MMSALWSLSAGNSLGSASDRSSLFTADLIWSGLLSLSSMAKRKTQRMASSTSHPLSVTPSQQSSLEGSDFASKHPPAVVEIYTDGACKGNPGPGGYAAILRFGNLEMEIFGSMPDTTNNQMELMGPIAGLNALKRPCQVTVYSDSEYVCRGFNNWMFGWVRNGWKTAKNEPVKNAAMWQQLLALRQIHDIKFAWVKGHAGHPLNERADQLAVLARNTQSNGKSSPAAIS